MSTVTCRIGSDMASLNGFKALVTFFREAEHAFTTAALLGMGLLPILELFLRTFCNTGIPGTSGYVQNLTLWVGFLGAMVASRERRHLSLSSGVESMTPRFRGLANMLGSPCFGRGGRRPLLGLFSVRPSRDGSTGENSGMAPYLGGGVDFAGSLRCDHLTLRGAGGGMGGACDSVCRHPGCRRIGFFLAPHASQLLWPGLAGLVAIAVLGAPIFVVLGGTAPSALLCRWDSRCLDPCGNLPDRRLPVDPGHPFVHPHGSTSLQREERAGGWCAFSAPYSAGCRGPGDRHHPGLCIFHDLHRRLRGDDSGTRGVDAAGAPQGWLQGAFLGGIAHDWGFTGTPVTTKSSSDPLWCRG